MTSMVTLALSGALSGSTTVTTTSLAVQTTTTTIIIGDDQNVLWTSPEYAGSAGKSFMPGSTNTPTTIALAATIPAAILAKARTIGILQRCTLMQTPSQAPPPPAPLAGKSFSAAGVAALMKPM
jgi:hypothetical protein